MSINGNERREAARQARMAVEFLAAEAMKSGPEDLGKSPDARKVEVLMLAGMFAEASKIMAHDIPALGGENVWELNARVLWHAFSSDSVLAPRFGVKLPFGHAVIGLELENIARELVIENSERYGFDFMDRDAFLNAWTSIGGRGREANGSQGWAPQPRAAISVEALAEVGAALSSSFARMETASSGGSWWRRGAADQVAAKIAAALAPPAIGAKIAARAATHGDGGLSTRAPSA